MAKRLAGAFCHSSFPTRQANSRGKATAVSTNSMASKHLKSTMFLSLRGFFRWFHCVLPAAWTLGRRLPRRHTVAGGHGSLAGPRFGHRAAPQGKGSRGCKEHKRPWPRGKTFLRQWDPFYEVDPMLIFQVFWWILFSILVEPAFDKRVFGARAFFYQRLELGNRLASPSPLRLFVEFKGVSILM